MPAGEIPEKYNIEHPEQITAIHKAFLAAGSDIVYANTFGANRLKMKKSGYSVQELISAGIACGKAATAGTDAMVALDIGPIGQLLEPLGTLKFEEAYDIFREEIEAGKDADLIVIETMTDLYETKAAVLAAKEHSDKPVFVTMTFEENGRTFTGCTVSAMALTLEGLGVDALGVNCSLGPKELLPVVEEICRWTTLPVIVKAECWLGLTRLREHSPFCRMTLQRQWLLSQNWAFLSLADVAAQHRNIWQLPTRNWTVCLL